MDDPNVIKIMVCMGMGICILFYIMYIRSKYIKQSIGNLLCLFVPKAGKGYWRLLPIQGDTVTLPPTREKKGRSYMMSDLARVPLDFPINRPRWLQTTIDGAVFDADSYEPMTNRSSKLLLSPERLYNLVNERFTNIGVEQAFEEQESRGKVPQRKGTRWSTVIIILLVMVLLGLGFWAFTMMNDMEALKAAAGVA